MRFLLFYNPYPLTQVGIFGIRKWPILFYLFQFILNDFYFYFRLVQHLFTLL